MPKHANNYVYIVKILSKKLQVELESCNRALYCNMSHKNDSFSVNHAGRGDRPFLRRHANPDPGPSVMKKITTRQFEIMAFIRDFEGEMPGGKRKECGNYLEHDLPGAKAVAADMCKVLENWTEEDLSYENH